MKYFAMCTPSYPNKYITHAVIIPGSIFIITLEDPVSLWHLKTEVVGLFAGAIITSKTSIITSECSSGELRQFSPFVASCDECALNLDKMSKLLHFGL
jgi:hypothetical protein